jgi:ABC-2 type transport system permease protein
MTISVLRSGPGYWFAGLGSMLRFDYGRTRSFAPMIVVIQTMMGTGMALLYGFLYPHLTPTRALYITTGAPTLALIPLGFAMLPGSIGTQKDEGTFDYVWTLPAPRSAQAAATFLLYTALALPGTALALLVATLRYRVHLSPSPLLVPAVLLCAVMAIAVGYGMALAIPNPLITNLVVNGLMFVVLLFSPIVYPPSQLPSTTWRS